MQCNRQYSLATLKTVLVSAMVSALLLMLIYPPGALGSQRSGRKKGPAAHLMASSNPLPPPVPSSSEWTANACEWMFAKARRVPVMFRSQKEALETAENLMNVLYSDPRAYRKLPYHDVEITLKQQLLLSNVQLVLVQQHRELYEEYLDNAKLLGAEHRNNVDLSVYEGPRAWERYRDFEAGQALYSMLILGYAVPRMNLDPESEITILELGGGTGATTRVLKTLFPKARIIVVEQSSTFVDGLRATVSGVEVLQHDMRQSLPPEVAEAGSIDLIVGISADTQFLTPEEYGVRIRDDIRLLKPGGFKVTDVDYNSRALLTRQSYPEFMESFVRNGFEVESRVELVVQFGDSAANWNRHYPVVVRKPPSAND